MVDSLAQLPLSLQQSCFGSDGGRLAVAGGVNSAEATSLRDVWVLAGVEFTWGTAAV